MDTLKRLFQSKERSTGEFENACKQCSALVKQREFAGQNHWWEQETDECFTEELQEKMHVSIFVQ